MKITIDIEYEEAIMFCDWVRTVSPLATGQVCRIASDIVMEMNSQIDNESACRAERIRATMSQLK